MADEEVQPAAPAAAMHSQLPFRIELPAPFTGEGLEPFSSWIQRFEVALEVSTAQLEKAKLLAARLSGPAFAYWQSLPPRVKTDYDQAKSCLSAVFGRTSFLATFQTHLNARPRRNQEPLEVYAADLTNLVAEAFPKYGPDAQSCEIFRRFVTGLDPSLQLKIDEHGAVTLEAALKVAVQCEQAQLALTVATHTPVMTVTSQASHSLQSPIADLTAAVADLKAELHDLRQTHLKQTDSRLDQLAQQVAEFPWGLRDCALLIPMAGQFDIQSERAFITAAASTVVSHLHMLPPEGVNLFGMTSHHHGIGLHQLGGLAILLICVTPWMTTVLPTFEDHATLFLIIMTHIASVQVTGRTSLLPGVAMTGIVEPHPPSTSALAIARTLTTVHDGQGLVRVVNPSPEPVSLAGGCPLGQVFSLSGRPQEEYTLVSVAATSSASSCPTPAVDLSHTCLTPSEIPQLETLLKDFADVFSSHPYDYGRTDLTHHAINTGDAKPIKLRPYRASPATQVLLQQEVDKLLEHGIIEESHSPWSAPVVLVRKKDGTHRFCVDYRRLNAVTIKDSHPLPRVDDTLDRLAGACVFSTIDLTAGYWQIPLHPRDKEKTAFSTGTGLFHFRMMPMGISNAPPSFQRLMELVLRGLHWNICLIYLDDIIVYSTDFAQHLQHLREVFQRFRSAGLKLKPSKCHLACSSVTFLGHQVSSAGVLFEWSPAAADAFKTLKHALTSPPILAFPNLSAPFLLYTDASLHAIGSVLSQRVAGKEHVIAYASHTLSVSERKWSTFDRELYAIVWSVRHFRHYLAFHPFTIITDHKPLVGLKKLPLDQDPTGRRARWAVELDLHDWTVIYRDGTKHLNADSMSRRPHNTSSDIHSPSMPEKPPMATAATQTAPEHSRQKYFQVPACHLRGTTSA
ncbi:hypothetical protein SRHO_G00123650 [Serrasalmus rhombeus]